MRKARKDAMDGGVIAVPDSRGWGPARRDTPVQHSSFRKIFSMKTQTSATNRDADSTPRVQIVEVVPEGDGRITVKVDDFGDMQRPPTQRYALEWPIPSRLRPLRAGDPDGRTITR